MRRPRETGRQGTEARARARRRRDPRALARVGSARRHLRDVLSGAPADGTAAWRSRSDEVGDIDLESGLWTIPRAKGGHAHEVPLAPAVAALLHAMPRQHGCEYVFSTRRARPIAGFGKLRDATSEAASVTGWRFHDLRRSAATTMAAAGIAKDIIRRVLGHAESDVTSTYVRHSWLPEKRTALETWAARVETIAREQPARRRAS